MFWIYCIAIIIPCHRVIGSYDSLTGYAEDLATKKKLLELENNLFNWCFYKFQATHHYLSLYLFSVKSFSPLELTLPASHLERLYQKTLLIYMLHRLFPIESLYVWNLCNLCLYPAGLLANTEHSKYFYLLVYNEMHAVSFTPCIWLRGIPTMRCEPWSIWSVTRTGWPRYNTSGKTGLIPLSRITLRLHWTGRKWCRNWYNLFWLIMPATMSF